VIEDLPVKVDDVGRVVIPMKVRKMMDIKVNDILLLSTNKDVISIKKQEINSSYKRLLDKIESISKNYELDFILVNSKRVVYSTLNKDIIDKNISLEVSSLKEDIFPIYGDKINITDTYLINKFYYYCSIIIVLLF